MNFRSEKQQQMGNNHATRGRLVLIRKWKLMCFIQTDHKNGQKQFKV